MRTWQVMRMSTPSSPVVKERKISQSASSKIDSIIKQLFLPMLGMPTPERTSFLPEDAEDQILRQVAQERPAALVSESDFVDYMVVLYRKFQRDQGAADNNNNIITDTAIQAVDEKSDLKVSVGESETADPLQPGLGELVLCSQLPVQIP